MLLCRQVVVHLVFLLIAAGSVAQPHSYSSENAHAHNDYENARPFYTAYENGFGSIEADIFISGTELLVAHDTKELALRRSLRELYLKPLDSALSSHHGSAYADPSKTLQMLIDIKTDAHKTLDALIAELNQFPKLIHAKSLKWVISGNRPDPNEFQSYPAFIQFDGVLSQMYDSLALRRIAMMSDDFKHFSAWNGTDDFPTKDIQQITTLISIAHAQHLPVRFWDAPDNPAAWKEFMMLGTDFINTDHVPELAGFLLKQAE